MTASVAVHIADSAVAYMAASVAVHMTSIVTVHAPVRMTASVTSGLFVGFVAGTVACCLLGSKITMVVGC